MFGLVKFMVVYYKDYKIDNCDVFIKDEVKLSCYVWSSLFRFRVLEFYGDKMWIIF